MAVREASRLDRTAGVGVQVLLATTAGADHLGPLVTFGIACQRFRTRRRSRQPCSGPASLMHPSPILPRRFGTP
jgi:hypothetical protein